MQGALEAALDDNGTDDEMTDLECLPETYTVPEAEARALFQDEDVQELSADLHEVLSCTTVEAMADAARKGMARMNLDKKKGSISHDRKHKSLRERWLSREPKPTGIEANDVNLSEKIIERNMHVKVKIEEGKGTTLVSAVEDYRVLGMYTKTYNKWFVSENKKQNWKRGMDKG